MAINIGKNSDGDVTYKNPPVERTLFPNIKYGATPEEIQEAVDAWLDDHPEATTTVEDGSILPVKLDSTNSATDGYVLSYNATAEKFEWYDIGGELDEINSDITDLKQDFNEYHPDLGSGYSAQLLSTVFIEDETPYNFRTSGGSADIGDREYDEIVGVSMPINQIIPNANKDFSKEFTGDTPYNYNAFSDLHIPVNAGHKYLVSASVTRNIATNNLIAISLWQNPPLTWFGNLLIPNGSPNGTVSSVFSVPNDASSIDVVMINNYSGKRGYEAGDSVSFDNFMVFDLTQMFGSAIADYVYGLEQSTAGSGVTWLKHHFPKIFDSGYIPYTAGEMQSVSGLSVHRMTGFNQWDEEWEVGTIDANGQPETSTSRIRSKNFIPIIPNTAYYIKWGSYGSGRGAFYDADKNLVWYSSNFYRNQTFTTPQNARYMKFSPSIDYGTTYNHDICINLHWDGERDGQYEEYKEYEYALDDSVVLRGILKLDSSNSLYADGDVYKAEGTIQRRYGIVDLGTLAWSYDGGYFYASSLPIVSNGYSNSTSAPMICSRYETVPMYRGDSGGYFTGKDKAIAYGYASGNKIFINDTSYSDPTTFKASLSGVMLVYEKATPTTETAETYQTPQIVDDWGTEEYVSTSLVPVGHDTKYANNLRAKLEMSPGSPEEDGDYIVRHNNGENQYVALGSTTTIQGILDRLTALENA